MSRKALYYPFIHIRDVDWLKATLLLFSQVRRMVPFRWDPEDGYEIRPFTAAHLIERANLGSPRAQKAQRQLAKKLERDAEDPKFLARFGREATLLNRAPDGYGFQIHQGKLHPKLQKALRGSGLAWEPLRPEPYDTYGQYAELHPRVGQAVMATLAIACAKADGLDIVGDRRSEGLHRCLLEKDADAVYETWLGRKRKDRMPEPSGATGRELFEFMIGVACDVRALDAKKLARMGEDREPIRHLMDRLGKRAKHIEVMDPGRERDEYFKDEVSGILNEWRRDRANMANYWRTFFGADLLDSGGSFLEKVAEKALSPPERFSGSSLTKKATGLVGGLAVGNLVSAGAGLAVALLVNAGESYITVRKRARTSHYRYLSMMEKAGVVFRTDFGSM